MNYHIGQRFLFKGAISKSVSIVEIVEILKFENRLKTKVLVILNNRQELSDFKYFVGKIIDVPNYYSGLIFLSNQSAYDVAFKN